MCIASVSNKYSSAMYVVADGFGTNTWLFNARARARNEGGVSRISRAKNASEVVMTADTASYQ